MEEIIYDFIKNIDINNILFIKDTSINENIFLNNAFNDKKGVTLSVNENDFIQNVKHSFSKNSYDLIIDNTDFSSENYLKIIKKETDEIPLLIIKSDKKINEDLNEYNLTTISLSENYDLIYLFDSLDKKLNNSYKFNPMLNNILNQIYLNEYNKNKNLKNKISSTIYPLSLLIHSKQIGGIKNLPLNIKSYKQLDESNFLNIGYYLRTYKIKNCNNVYLHYLYNCLNKNQKPNEEFNYHRYIEANPDLNNISINPALHYLLYGRKEERDINLHIRGTVQETVLDNVLRGWIAEIGNNYPIDAKLKIDNKIYPINANIYREDLEKKHINHGEHGFEFIIPEEYKDNNDHKIELIYFDTFKIDEITYNSKKNDRSSKKPVKGAFQSSIKDTLIKGWVAEIGNNEPVPAKIKIENKSYPIIADIYREDLKLKHINQGKHGFEFSIPDDFIDGKEHKIQLIAENKVISEISHSFVKYDFENNIERFFSHSMTSPEMILPLNEPRKKILALMNNIAKYLCGNVNDNPLVTVIMPVYNREDLIENAVTSVLTQSYKNLELIIINDNSTDNTLDKINSFDDNRIKLINNPENYGVSKSRNIGLKESRGKYIMYLDSDNDWEKDYVKTMIGAFNVLEDADALYSGQYVYEKEKNNLKYIRYGTINKGLLMNRNYVDLNSFCHTREIYEENGGFDEGLKRFVDWDLILKYMTYGKIYSIPVILSNYYFNIAENSISNDVKLLNQSEIVIENQKKRLESKKYDFNKKHGVSVIIPSYESLKDLKECLNSLFELKASWLEIIVIDNNSSEDVIKYLIDLKDKHKIKLILNNENLGFTYAVNQGIEISDIRNDILLLNNDAVVTKNAIPLLQKAAYELKDCGITVPQQVLPANTKTINVHVPFAQKNIECDVNLSNHHKNIINVPLFHNGEYTEISFAAFFCVYIKRDTYNKSLGLDAELGRHFRSDMIYCNYIRSILNQKIYHVSEARVYHKLQQATSTLRKKSEKEHNLLYVQNRWSPEEQKKYGFKTAKWDVD